MAGLPGTMQPYTLPAHTSPAPGRAGLGHPETHENPSTRHDAALAMALQASMYEDSTTAHPGPARSTLLLPSLSWVGIVPDLRFTVGCFAAAFGGACKLGFRRVAVSHQWRTMAYMLCRSRRVHHPYGSCWQHSIRSAPTS